MGKTRAAYPPEFRRQMVDLVRAGRSPEELAREFEPTAQSIRNWLAQTVLGQDPFSGVTCSASEAAEGTKRHCILLFRTLRAEGFYPPESACRT
jgi:transposase